VNEREPRRGGGVFISIPVLNEAENILPLLNGIDRALAGMPYAVCVVDDGSRDGTVDLLRQRQISTPDTLHVLCRTKMRRGSQRGGALLAALRWGLDRTDCEVFVEMDGDLSHRAEEVPAALDLLYRSQSDVVIASKYVPGSRVTNRPLGRRLVSRICSAAVRLLLSGKVTDYSNGLRFYTRGAAELVADTRIRFTSPIYLSEVLALWLRSGLRVQEIETVYVGRGEGISKLRLIDLVKAALAVFEIALRYHVTGFGRRVDETRHGLDLAEQRSATLQK
jgi:dolichol-phosphate mannosyltransferase